MIPHDQSPAPLYFDVPPSFLVDKTFMTYLDVHTSIMEDAVLPDRLRNLRGGAIYAGANVSPTTARTWPIEIGTKSGAGHKRYDLLDVIALTLMKEMTASLSVTAARAALIVGEIQTSLHEVVKDIFEQRSITKKWQWTGAPYAIFEGKEPFTGNLSEATKVRIVKTNDDLLEILSGKHAATGSLVISLSRIVSIANLGLDVALENAGGRGQSDE